MKLIREMPLTWLVFILALVIYGLATGPTLARQSIAPHYVYLADALLHGRLDLTQPPSSYDLLVVDGRAYVAGSPMPAILLIPFVAVFGVGVSDILFGMIVGALNAALVYDLLGKFAHRDARTTAYRWWLTLLFALGTPHLYLAALGSVWFNAHVVAIFFGLLAVRAVLAQPGMSGLSVSSSANSCLVYAGVEALAGKWRWFLAGIWLACASLARPTMLFGSPFFILLIWFTHSRRDRIRPLVFFSATVALGIAAHGLYNAARFGSPADFGYAYTVGAPNITTTYARYGGFNARFLPCNLFVSVLGLPEVHGYVPPITYDVCGYLLDGVNLSDAAAPIAPNPLGMSLFLVTPAFVLLFAARRRDVITLAAWAGLLATMIPLWMYHNTGSLQFGYRYWMDAAPMWLLLLSVALDRRRSPTEAAGLGRRPSPIAPGLILVSVAINVWGFLWMFEKFVGETWLEAIARPF